MQRQQNVVIAGNTEMKEKQILLWSKRILIFCAIGFILSLIGLRNAQSASFTQPLSCPNFTVWEIDKTHFQVTCPNPTTGKDDILDIFASPLGCTNYKAYKYNGNVIINCGAVNTDPVPFGAVQITLPKIVDNPGNLRIK